MSQLDDDLAIAPPRPADAVARIVRELRPGGRATQLVMVAATPVFAAMAVIHPAAATTLVALIPGFVLERRRQRAARRVAREGMLVDAVVQRIESDRALVTVASAGAPVPMRFATYWPPAAIDGEVRVLMLPEAGMRLVYVIGTSNAIVPCKVDLVGLPSARLR